jgi:hypothetical protein
MNDSAPVDIVLQLLARHDGVQHAVFEQELGTLEAFRELPADGSTA